VVSSWKETAHELKRKDIKYAMALLDLQLSDTNILTHIEQLLFQYPDLKILIASTSPEQVYAADLLKSGVYGYFDKSLPTEELVFAIKTVLKGEVYTREAYRKRLTEPGMEL
jgi:two-component system invasion response regulator UvrY